MCKKNTTCSVLISVDMTISEYSVYNSKPEGGFGSLFGTLVGIGAMISVIYATLNWNETDEKKIQHVFKNIGYKVGDREPRLIKKERKEQYTDYVYSVPYGLIDDERLQPILQKTLIRPVKVMFRGKLIIRVYNSNLPNYIRYDWEQTEKHIVPIGQSLDGIVYHDFDAIPHMTVAGMTRMGKTAFLKLIIAHLMNNNCDIKFCIIDLKERLEFSEYERYKQVKSVVGNNQEANNMLDDILERLDSDLKKGIKNVVGVHDKRTFIIVDEAAELDDKCQNKLSKIARIGGALGYRLIYATQYPTADTLPRQIKQNSDAKVSFRLPTKVASRVAIDENGAEELICPGRAIYRTHERVEIQTFYVDESEMFERLRRFEVDKREDKKTRKDTIKFI